MFKARRLYLTSISVTWELGGNGHELTVLGITGDLRASGRDGQWRRKLAFQTCPWGRRGSGGLMAVDGDFTSGLGPVKVPELAVIRTSCPDMGSEQA